MPENKEKEVKIEEKIPKKIQDAYEALMVQVNDLARQETQISTTKIEGLGALKVFIKLYPGLQKKEMNGDS